MGEKVSAFYKKQFLLKEAYEKVFDDIVKVICKRFWKDVWPDHYMKYVLDDLTDHEFKALKKYRQMRYWVVIAIFIAFFVGEVTTTFVAIFFYLALSKARKKEDASLAKILLRDQRLDEKVLTADLDDKYTSAPEKTAPPPPVTPPSPWGGKGGNSKPVVERERDEYDTSNRYDTSDMYD